MIFLQCNFWLRKIFTKLQKIINSSSIYILPCKLDLSATWNGIKSVILSTWLNFFLRFGTFHFWPPQYSRNFRKWFINIYILPCKLSLCITWNLTKSVILIYFDLFEFSTMFWSWSVQEASENSLFCQYLNFAL